MGHCSALDDHALRSVERLLNRVRAAGVEDYSGGRAVKSWSKPTLKAKVRFLEYGNDGT